MNAASFLSFISTLALSQFCILCAVSISRQKHDLRVDLMAGDLTWTQRSGDTCLKRSFAHRPLKRDTPSSVICGIQESDFYCRFIARGPSTLAMPYILCQRCSVSLLFLLSHSRYRNCTNAVHGEDYLDEQNI